MAACSTTATLESIDATSLTIGGTTVLISGGGHEPGHGGRH
jgi:hypothetical protein